MLGEVVPGCRSWDCWSSPKLGFCSPGVPRRLNPCCLYFCNTSLMLLSSPPDPSPWTGGQQPPVGLPCAQVTARVTSREGTTCKGPPGAEGRFGLPTSRSWPAPLKVTPRRGAERQGLGNGSGRWHLQGALGLPPLLVSGCL